MVDSAIFFNCRVLGMHCRTREPENQYLRPSIEMKQTCTRGCALAITFSLLILFFTQREIDKQCPSASRNERVEPSQALTFDHALALVIRRWTSATGWQGEAMKFSCVPVIVSRPVGFQVVFCKKKYSSSTEFPSRIEYGVLR